MRKNKEAQLSATLYNEYHSARDEWASAQAKDRDYYLNKQWTEDEATTVKDRGQAPLVVNRIYPVVQQKLAQLASHKPVIRAMAVEESDYKKAEMWTLMLEYMLQQSDFQLVDLDVKRNHIVSGVGYYYAYIDSYADDGKGEVKVISLPPDLVYVDPNSRKVDYSDADHIMISQLYTFQQALNMFPDKRRSLNKAKNQLLETQDYFGTELHSDDNTVLPQDVDYVSGLAEKQSKVRIIERFSKVRVPYYIAINQGMGFYDVVDQAKYNQFFAEDDDYDTTRIYRTHIERVVTAGDSVLLAKEILPIEDYPIIPSPNVWVGTPYPMSDVRYLRPIQDEINKRRSLLILNATSGSSSKWLVEEGSIEEKEWDRKAHIPGARLRYRAGFNPPTPIFPAPLPAAIAQLEAEGKHDLDYTAGVFGVSHGDPQDAPETYGATLALEEHANRRVSANVEVFAHAKKVLGRVLIGLAQDVYTVPKFIRVTGDEGTVQEVVVNEGRNFLDQEKYDVIIESGRFAPTNRIAHAQFMMNLYERGAIDNSALIQELDIPNKEDLLQRLGTINQQSQTIQALQQELKNEQGLNQTMRRQLQQAGVKGVVDEVRVLEKGELLETKAKEAVERKELDLAEKEAELELEHVVRMHELELKADRQNRTPDKGAGN